MPVTDKLWVIGCVSTARWARITANRAPGFGGVRRRPDDRVRRRWRCVGAQLYW